MNFADGAVVSANPAAQEILGRTEQEIIDAGIEGFVDTADPRYGQMLEERTRTGKCSGELNFKKKDGTIFPVEISSVLFRDSRDRIFTATMFRDVSWLKQIEGVMQRNEKRFRELADAMPQLMWTATPDGLLDYFNRRSQEYSHLVRRRSSGFWEWNATVHPEDLQITLSFMRKNPKPGEIMQVEHRLRDKKGFYRWHLSRRAPVCNEQGRIIKWIGTTTDIHDLKEKEESARGTWIN